MSPSITDLSQRLRSLIGSEPPTSERAEVESFVLERLESTLSGHESLAARVLGSWGRAQDKAHIKRWFTERMLYRKIGYRGDLVKVFTCFRHDDDDDVAYLLRVFRENPSHRVTVAQILMDFPQSLQLARQLLEDGDPEQGADAIRCLMWSRARFGRSLRVLAANPDELIGKAAKQRLALFERFPKQYC